MREYSTPLAIAVPTTGSLVEDVVNNGERFPGLAVFSRRTTSGWQDVTAAEFLAQVRSTAKGLLAAGVQAGDRVAILSRTRYEWTLLDYAIWYAGAVGVPIYETASADQIELILTDAEARAVVVESSSHLRRVNEVRAKAPELRNVWSIEEGAVDILGRLGADVPDEDLEARRNGLGPESLATIIYTSGTTGPPKGCLLSHANFLFEVCVTADELDELFGADGAATLLFLPLAHVLARAVQVAAVRSRVRLGHSTDIRSLQEDVATFAPTFVLAVPRALENVFNTFSQRDTAAGKGKAFNRATDTAIAYSKALDQGRVSPLLRARHAVADRLVYARLRAELGGHCRYAVAGGAPLGERLAHFYRGIGIPVLEGYGLTETTAATTANTPGATKIGTVGRPIGGTTVRVAEDGELLVKGGQVFGGYWRDEAASAAVLDQDGWFHTGDLGEIDDEGFVKITGRKKEILVTAGGKNVAPAALEDRICAHPLVGQCMVVGDGRPYIAALVTLDEETFAEWAEDQGKHGSLAQLVEDPDLLAEVQSAVDEANRAVSRAESVRRFAILPVDWTEEAGQLTPSLKLRRNVVLREFRRDIEALYDR